MQQYPRVVNCREGGTDANGFVSVCANQRKSKSIRAIKSQFHIKIPRFLTRQFPTHKQTTHSEKMSEVEIPCPPELQECRAGKAFTVHPNAESFFLGIVELGKEASRRVEEGRIKDVPGLLVFLSSLPSHVCFTTRECFADQINDASAEYDDDDYIAEWRDNDTDEFFEVDDRYFTITMPMYESSMKIKVHTDVLDTMPRSAKASKTTVEGIEIHDYTLPTPGMTRDVAREMMKKTGIPPSWAKWNPEEMTFDSDYEPYVAIFEVVG